MQVELNNISKIFQGHSVFKGVNLTIPEGYKGVILGGNGSGKSTLLKVISSAVVPSSGEINYLSKQKAISINDAYKYIAFCGPYTELIEDFTLHEIIDFQSSFKPFLPGISKRDVIDRVYLKKFENKRLKTYSSGMKQRVRLALSIMSNSSLILLDEPTSNLDPNGKEWYNELANDFLGNRTVVVASNYFTEEYRFATAEIKLEDYQ